MNNFGYTYTILSKNTKETLFSNITDLQRIGDLLNDAFFEYIATESMMKRLGECKLENEDYICIIKINHGKIVA